MLIRRYLKLAYIACERLGVLDTLLSELPWLPVELSAIPIKYAEPSVCRLWVETEQD